MRTSMRTTASVKNQNSLRNLFLSFSITLFIFSTLFIFDSVFINENSNAKIVEKVHNDVQKQASIGNEVK